MGVISDLDGITITQGDEAVRRFVEGPVADDIKARGEKVLADAVANAPRDTGQLADSLGLAVTVTGAETVEAVVGVVEGRNERQGSDATNTEVLIFENFGDGHSPATHFMEAALTAGRD